MYGEIFKPTNILHIILFAIYLFLFVPQINL